MTLVDAQNCQGKYGCIGYRRGRQGGISGVVERLFF